MIHITHDIAINPSEIEMDFIRSSGPGGQNVNKVASAVQLRFDVRNSSSLPLEVRNRLTRLAGKRMTVDGELIIDARRFRSQERNRQDALDRLTALVRKAADRPRPRRRTSPTHASKQRRLDSKHHRTKIKQGRRLPGSDE